ncbi:retrotransposon nucleocapsid protein, partial [Planoprotostelium fungivorum]
LPKEYRAYAAAFVDSVRELPLHGPQDLRIDIQEGRAPPFGPLYSLSAEELKLVHDYIETMVSRGLIRPSTSPCGAPILFARKKDGSLRLCVDYRKLNDITVKNVYPLPLIPQLLDRLGSAKIFTKLDLKDAYWLIRIREGDEWKTAFRTRYGLFEYLVMPFGLSNAPGNFQAYVHSCFSDMLDQFPLDHRVNEQEIKWGSSLPYRLGSAKIFTKLDLKDAYWLICIREGDEWKTAFRTRYGLFEYLVMPFGLSNAPGNFQAYVHSCFSDMLDRFVIIYLDDFLIFSESEEEHVQHVSLVLQRMIEKKLFCNLKKCQFHTTRVEFLGYDISPLGLHMCPDRIKSIQDWKPPTNVKETQSFLGFCNFYRNFIPYYSTLSSPLSNLTRKTVAWEWGTAQQKAFDDLKTAFASADVVRHFDNTLGLVLETDASDFAISGILSQTHPDGLRPISFYSRKMKEAELNYDTHDKELLAIVECLKAWRHWILGVSTPLNIYTDHENLRWFSSKQHLNRRQIRWSQFLADFNYKLIHRPGKSNVKADLLSRRAQDALDMGDKLSQNQCLLHPELFAAAIIEEEPSLNLKFEESVAELSSKDPFFVSTVEWLKADDTRPSLPAGCGRLLDAKHSEDKDKGFRTEKKLLFYNELLYIPMPLRVTVLQTRHDTPLAGHFGVNKTHELIKRDYWWPKLLRDVEGFVKTCSICQRTKVARQKPAGKLNPLPAPSSRWTSVTMDFIVELPECQGYDAIMVVVDRFTKMAHFTACTTSITSEQTALLFIDRVVGGGG